MSNYPQDKFEAPDISGRWKYWGNIQNLTSTGGFGPITSLSGFVDINQNNLFFTYTNTVLNINRVGVLTKNIQCVDGKTITQWIGNSVNSGSDTTVKYTPYCYKNGKPTKIITVGTSPGPVGTNSSTGVDTFYLERV